ncbi:PH domain-containing protein [Virgibacillus sp. 179-BFC.A HS]|uniref:PH domain-containing protein n=1 Tax=Tigheibacillus jepli TaxID=3035914 RepID=A0ABU5CDC8_9BACI|nr:PH domain-containing protein [Virgibacillus sp. 179-BFC.A HS]MDY0404340.1 PH domain-containing protein [Virgibacillus sp. 179-BFC.A HS]
MRSQPKDRIHQDALKVWRITEGIVAIIAMLVAIALFVIAGLTPMPMWIPIIFTMLVLLMTYVIVVWAPRIRWYRWRYEVRENEIDLLHGIWWTHRTLVPMVKVQHVDTEQGPLLRRYGLATVKVTTAGGSHEIPALSMEDAEHLRDRIAVLARVTEDDE